VALQDALNRIAQSRSSIRLLPQATPAPRLAEEMNRRDAETEPGCGTGRIRLQQLPLGRARPCHTCATHQGDSGSATVTRGYPQAVTWTSPPADQGTAVPPIFQAGHAGSIPVARSTTPAQARVLIIWSSPATAMRTRSYVPDAYGAPASPSRIDLLAVPTADD
jgi:hypothetical protein